LPPGRRRITIPDPARTKIVTADDTPGRHAGKSGNGAAAPGNSEFFDYIKVTEVPAANGNDPLARLVVGVKSAGRNLDDLIPPRRWLLGTTFCGGVLSGLTGSGGVGKSALRILQLMALALDRGDLVGEHVYRRSRVLLVCLEDDEAEVQRRVRAACMHHGLAEADLDGWFFYWCPWPPPHFVELDNNRDVVLGEMGAALERIILARGIGLVSVDPFVRSHGVDENSNQQISVVTNALIAVGHACGCAVDYVHHHRKGVAFAGEADAVRGASALVDASRLVKTATKMAKEEAEELGVEQGKRRYFIRLDDPKLNFAPPATETTWFRLVSVDIGNATAEYPDGDNVQSVERWHPASIWRMITSDVANSILDDLDEWPVERKQNGGYHGRRCSNRAGANDQAWLIVKRHAPTLTEKQCREVIKTWLASGVLHEEQYYDTELRKERIGLFINPARRPGDAT
jgi:hypothetical protein